VNKSFKIPFNMFFFIYKNILYEQLTSLLSGLLGISKNLEFLESGHGHSHLALLDTDYIRTDADTSDTQKLENGKKMFKIPFNMLI
jgi:hypothetical protein